MQIKSILTFCKSLAVKRWLVSFLNCPWELQTKQKNVAFARNECAEFVFIIGHERNKSFSLFNFFIEFFDFNFFINRTVLSFTDELYCTCCCFFFQAEFKLIQGLMGLSSSSFELIHSFICENEIFTLRISRSFEWFCWWNCTVKILIAWIVSQLNY